MKPSRTVASKELSKSAVESLKCFRMYILYGRKWLSVWRIKQVNNRWVLKWRIQKSQKTCPLLIKGRQASYLEFEAIPNKVKVTFSFWYYNVYEIYSFLYFDKRPKSTHVSKNIRNIYESDDILSSLYKILKLA